MAFSHGWRYKVFERGSKYVYIIEEIKKKLWVEVKDLNGF